MVTHNLLVNSNIIGVPFTIQRVGTLHWKAGFETNDWSELIAGEGGPELKWSGTGYAMTDPSGNEKASIVTSPVHSGIRACRLETMVPTVGSEWRNSKIRVGAAKNLAEAYYGCAFYFPASFDAPGWMNIMQLQENGPGVDGEWHLYAWLDTGRGSPGAPMKMRLYTRMRITTPGEQLLWDDPDLLPLGRWFTLVIYLRTGVNGQVKLWKDRVLVSDTMLNLSSASGYVGPAFDAGMYGGSFPAEYMVVDEMRVASTLELATPKTV